MNVRLALLLLCAATTSGCFITPDARIGVDTELVYATSHIRRGMTQNENGVVRPAMTLTLPVDEQSSLLIDARGAVNLSGDTGDAWLPPGHSGEFSEIDLGLIYSLVLGVVDLTTGLVSYSLPNGTQFRRSGERGGSNEFFISASTEAPLGLVPRVAVHYDYDEADGVYLVGELNRGFELDERWFASLQAGVSFSDDGHSLWAYGLADESVDVRGSGTVEFQVDDNTRVKLTAAYASIVTSQMERWFDSILIDSNVAWVELGLAWGM